MTASVVTRAWSWRSIVWAGVVGSVIAWTWAWFRVSGPVGVMAIVALATVVLAYRGTAGLRVALAGLIVAGFAMFLAGLYMTYRLLLEGAPSVGAADVVTVGVLPMVAAVVLLLGATAGFRRQPTA